MQLLFNKTKLNEDKGDRILHFFKACNYKTILYISLQPTKVYCGWHQIQTSSNKSSFLTHPIIIIRDRKPNSGRGRPTTKHMFNCLTIIQTETTRTTFQKSNSPQMIQTTVACKKACQTAQVIPTAIQQLFCLVPYFEEYINAWRSLTHFTISP